MTVIDMLLQVMGFLLTHAEIERMAVSISGPTFDHLFNAYRVVLADAHQRRLHLEPIDRGGRHSPGHQVCGAALLSLICCCSDYLPAGHRPKYWRMKGCDESLSRLKSPSTKLISCYIIPFFLIFIVPHSFSLYVLLELLAELMTP